MGRSTTLSPLSEVAVLHSDNEWELAEEVEVLNRIHALSLRLASSDTLAEVLQDVLRTATGLVGARLGSAQLLTPEGNLGMVAEIGFGDSIVDKFAVVGLKDCSTCALALKQRSRVVVSDLHSDRDFSEIAAMLQSYGAVAVVSTPVLDKSGKVLAMFSVYWLEEHEPSDRELRALDLCADLAGRHVERSFVASALRDREKRQALLMRELAHRGKNLLSVVQAIAARSLCGDRTLDDAREVFIGRLQALSNTYNTLTAEAPEKAMFQDIVSAGLKSLNERAEMRGPAILVPAKMAQTLSLALHELATNAAKYGALSVPSGRIEVTWELAGPISDSARFVFQWSEKNGPPVKLPERTGFGSVILTSIVGSELFCTPTIEYAKNGFQYRFECAASIFSEAGDADA